MAGAGFVVERSETLSVPQHANYPRPRASCFEYRVDDEGPTGSPNYNPAFPNLWAFHCENNSSEQFTFTASQYVDIRMVFGAEGDERFDWTRFYVLTPPNKDECKDGDWEAMGFKNQGQCVRFVETGKDSRVGDQTSLVPTTEGKRPVHAGRFALTIACPCQLRSAT